MKHTPRRLTGRPSPWASGRQFSASKAPIPFKKRDLWYLLKKGRQITLITCLSIAAGIGIAFAPTLLTDLAPTLLPPDQGKDSSLSGIAGVIDGDTIDIHGTRVRLQGIDAPESGQSCFAEDGKSYSCGTKARIYLKDLTGLALLRCEGDERDKYDRLLAICYLQDRDINAEMVRAGWAVAYRSYSNRYLAEERAAKTARTGLWQGRFDMPWDWRQEQRVASAVPIQGCNIKGNISNNGRVYHVPSSRSYDKTQINPNRGERWFCSEEEALAAGWRAPRSPGIFN